MNLWFGESWGAPVCSPETHTETPTGQCVHCDEEIVAGDQGVLIYGQSSVADVPFHIDCFLRTVVGSVGHQNKTCGCHHGGDGDPEGMSRRQAATAAVQLYNRNLKATRRRI